MVKREEEEIVSASCSFCGLMFDKEMVKCNGFGEIKVGFGYGSVFDDDVFELQICDKCFMEKYSNLLLAQFKDKGYDLEQLRNNVIDKR